MPIKSILAKGAVVVLFSQFGAKSHVSEATDFWKWFSANEALLYSWESDRDTTFNRLAL